MAKWTFASGTYKAKTFASGTWDGVGAAPPLPVANFVGSPLSGTIPLSVQFSDLSTNSTSWLWDFGDGHASTLENPTHTYAAAGSFTVSLTATNAGGSNTKIVANYIQAKLIPFLSPSGSASSMLLFVGQVPERRHKEEEESAMVKVDSRIEQEEDELLIWAYFL
jgi:PKD repeat protein